MQYFRLTEEKNLAAEACNKMIKEAVLDLLQNLLCTFFATKFSGFLTASFYENFFFYNGTNKFFCNSVEMQEATPCNRAFLIAVNGLVKQALFWESASFFLGHLYGHLMELNKADT